MTIIIVDIIKKLLIQVKQLIISAPPSCKTHQSEWDDLTKVETHYKDECGYDKVKEKYLAGTLQQPDLVKCYRPQCDNEQYTIKQCSFLFNEWCWCSTPHGQAIAGTFQKDMPMGFCSTCKFLNHLVCNEFGIVNYCLNLSLL